MNFSEAEAYLYSLGNEVSAMKLGLDAMRSLLTALGDPQKNYLKVQVAGTNGKGSVCASLDSICNTAGIKTGTFTSPHLVSITERVRINGVDISEEEFARHAGIVREVSERLVRDGMLETVPTFFEQVTAIALFAFADAAVEVGILETGLGGRLDATTAADAEIAAITRIDLDHQEYLGVTIEEIAAEKAAIITSGTRDVVIGDQLRSVMAILRERCRKFGIEPLNDKYEPWTVRSLDGELVKVHLSLLAPERIRLGLRGRHQSENAQTAVRAAAALHYHGVFSKLLRADAENEIRILAGLKKARHPGRLEYQGKYLFDGAHNVGGARALAEYLTEFEERPITMLFGAMKDKEICKITEILFPLAETVILTQAENSRALGSEEVALQLPAGSDRAKILLTGNVADALRQAEAITSSDGIIVVTGSLYLVGEAKKLVNN